MVDILVVENYPDSPLGLIEEELARQAIVPTMVSAYLGEPLPTTPEGYDGIVVLGGAQNALDDDAFPYLPHLADLIRAFAEADKAVLGVCLGAQLAARGLGGNNILGNPTEFGYLPVEALAEGLSDPLLSALGGSAPMFHFHSDTFTLPPGAVHLASSQMTAHQAFRWGRACYGIQFHMEVTPAILDVWTALAGELFDAERPDWKEKLIAQRAAHAASANRIGCEMTRAWLDLARQG